MENVELLERLGAGSFGRVYKCRCVGSQQMSALLRFAFGPCPGLLSGSAQVYLWSIPSTLPSGLAPFRPQAFAWSPWRASMLPCVMMIDVVAAVAGWLTCLGLMTWRRVGVAGVGFVMLIGEFIARWFFLLEKS